MTNRKLIARVTATVTVLCLAALCYGKVYRRAGGWRHSRFPAEYLGGKPVYRASMLVNGGTGELEVYGCKSDFATVIAKLRNTVFAGKPDELAVNDGLALGILRTDEKAARMVVVGLPGECVVFMLEQSPGLVAFIDRLAQITKGRVFSASGDEIGDLIVTDYVRGR